MGNHGLNILPQFKVDKIIKEVRDTLIYGSFNNLKSKTLSRGWLYNVKEYHNSLLVDVKEFNPESKSAILISLDDDYNYILKSGAVFPFIDSYWNARDIGIILTGNIAWVRTEFKSSDANSFKLNGFICLQREENEPPKGSEFIGKVKDGWDHEHCFICMATIGSSGAAFGYTNEEDWWACETCYEQYIKLGDLSFVLQWFPK